jgi:hypothetical protein
VDVFTGEVVLSHHIRKTNQILTARSRLSHEHADTRTPRRWLRAVLRFPRAGARVLDRATTNESTAGTLLRTNRLASRLAL